MSPETARFLIEQRLEFFNTLGIVCITWWTSSVVFVGTLLAVNLKPEFISDVRRSRHRSTIIRTVRWFIWTIICFGVGVVIYLMLFQLFLAQPLRLVGAPVLSFFNEIGLFIFGMTIGTLNFGQGLRLWGALWNIVPEVELAQSTSLRT